MSDDFETWFDRGVTDGLPVVPPSRERVDAMLAATERPRDELVAQVPPNFGRATVEKLAVNAVMAGCRPEYFPVVLAVVEAACDPVFNLHGQSGTTNAASPLIIINGPMRQALEVNCAAGVFGPGYRANATIGRALRLVMINLGGTRAGQISMSTMGHPGRYTYCIGEYEEASPWEPLHVERGFAPDRQHGDALLRRRPVHDQRSPEPVGVAARGVAGMVGRRHLEPQELSALRPHAVRHRAGARQDAGRRALVEAGLPAVPLRDDPPPGARSGCPGPTAPRPVA